MTIWVGYFIHYYEMITLHAIKDKKYKKIKTIGVVGVSSWYIIVDSKTENTQRS